MNLDMSNQSNSGLLRFRSATSSLFSNFSTNGVEKGGGSESTDGLTSRFLGSSGDGDGSNLVGQSFQDLIEDKGIIRNGYSQLPPHPRESCSNSASMDTSFRVVSSSVGMDSQPQPKMGSNLIRQNSSPAGLFSHLFPQTGYRAIRGVGSYRVGNGGCGELSPPSRLNRQMSFSSGVPSSLGMLSRISEIEADTVEENGINDEKGGNDSSDSRFYGSDYPLGLWNESSHFTRKFSGLKREVQDDDKLFLGAQNSNGELLNRPPMLSHHLSLPKTSGEMAAMDKLLHFQDSVPCKIRAKRGCATHPRSIAERVRRTRISERMRKLQELVPNMDKQTNTADMLDLAVDYIKNLQKQYKTLSDGRANCRCSSMQKLVQT